ncbi:S-adenosyl-L-methionine-dependent methyltransferase [Auricularia subglabra TFB-10046 SS5]|nr:S-adenosyl-L-methionine-dependent methyltransferase [Auricularia subglabra TFB-10046 SS5]
MFAILQCDKVPLASIMGPPITLEDVPSGGGSLFCRFIFVGAAWISLQQWHAIRKRRGPCFVKAAKGGLHDHRATFHDAPTQKVWSRGVEYHRYDFVFLRPKATDVSVIAQIRMVKNDGKVQVAFMDRGDADGHLGERCLLQHGDASLVSPGRIVGRCRVVVGKPNLEEMIADPWLFYTEQALDDTCSICEKLEVRQTLLNEAFEKDNKQKMQMLDPFCGAGGLTAGIERGSRCIQTKFAVDSDEEAAKAFAKNHPHATVFHDDANSFLTSLDQHTCIPDVNGNEISPADRKHGHIDVICAGPPCQGHSTLNSHRTADDPKNCLILTALSLVEHIRPRYLVIENVVMIMGWRLMAEQRGQGIIRGGETHGGIFLITSILLRLGYQVRIGLLNAGMHGTPQNRRRFFLIAAEPGSTLPDFPHPTHAFPKAKTLKMAPFPTAQPGWPVDDGEEAVGDDEMRLPPLCVPHPKITVGDAIGDLKGYNWKRNPERQHNAPSFPCDLKKGCNPNMPNAYARNAASEFQVRARENTEVMSAKQLQHVTAGFKEYIVRNVWDIPIRADGEDENARNPGWTAIDPDSRRAQYGLADPTSHVSRDGMREGRYYRRLKMNGHFATLVTNVRPTAKQSQVLHPNQNRLVSVREQARAQGFPDDFKFVGNAMAMQRQIGNAVPVTLAEAIGRELRKSMFTDWLKSPNGQKQCDIIDQQLHPNGP